MPPTTGPNQGIILVSIILDAGLFGLVSEQFYTYWTVGFKDSLRVRLFVVAQFVLVAFQCLIMWQQAWVMFIIFPFHAPTGPPSPKLVWAGPINAICQLVIILMANTFLAFRIYSLTRSRLQCCLVIALSAIAFSLGMVTDVMTWQTQAFPTLRRDLSFAWHAIQAAVECLITFLLSRVLLKARSGMRQSDSMIIYIVRNVIQTGFLATAWALVGLATWTLLPNNISVFRIFDVTSGTVYTHAIFETLLSRHRLRERLKLPSYFHIDLEPSQEGQRSASKTSGQLRGSVSTPCVVGLSSNPPNASGIGPGSTTAGNGDVIELVTLK